MYLPATALVANHNGLVNQTYLPATALVANHNGLVNQTYLPATALVANQSQWSSESNISSGNSFGGHSQGLVNQTYLPATASVANHNGLVNQTYLPATALVANHNGLVNKTYLPATALVANQWSSESNISSGNSFGGQSQSLVLQVCWYERLDKAGPTRRFKGIMLYLHAWHLPIPRDVNTDRS